MTEFNTSPALTLLPAVNVADGKASFDGNTGVATGWADVARFEDSIRSISQLSPAEAQTITDR